MFDISKAWPDLKAVEKLGEGSFGKVYKCEREEFGIKSVCAVKVISIPQSQAEIESMSFEGVSAEGARSYYSDVVSDFANEIKLMEMLKGAPNIVNVENFRIIERENEIGWDIYIRMEYLQSFVSYSKNKKFTEEEVKKFALDISNALAICSKNGIIHRDIKPDNIFVDKFGSFKLGDFGVAKKLEGTMSIMSKKGTYSYMAPEVFKGEKYDCRADIYSLGMVMYKLLNRNRDPFVDVNSEVVSFKDRNEAIERRRSGERLPAPVDASPSMAAVILKACEFRPEDRYATVEEFREALNALHFGEVTEEPTLSARDYFDKTVAEKYVELPTIVPVNEELGDATIDVNYTVKNEEPTAVLPDETTEINADELTESLDRSTVIVAEEKNVINNSKSNDDLTIDADATETADVSELTDSAVDYGISESFDDDENESDSKKTEKEEKKFNFKAIIAAALAIVAVVAVILVARIIPREKNNSTIAKKQTSVSSSELTDGVNIETITTAMNAPKASEELITMALKAYEEELAQYDDYYSAYVFDINKDCIPEVICQPGETGVQYALTFTEKNGLCKINLNGHSSVSPEVYISEDNIFYMRDDGHNQGTAFYHFASIYKIDETGFVSIGEVEGDEPEDFDWEDESVFNKMDEKYESLFEQKLNQLTGEKTFKAYSEVANVKNPVEYLNFQLSIDLSDKGFIRRLYQEYLDSDTSKNRYFEHKIEYTEQGLYFGNKYNGKSSVRFIDIDADGVEECYLTVPFTSDNSLSYEIAYIFDINENKNIEEVFKSNDCGSYRNQHRFAIIEDNGSYFIHSFIPHTYICTGSVYSYDGEKLNLVWSYDSDGNPGQPKEEWTTVVSTEYDFMCYLNRAEAYKIDYLSAYHETGELPDDRAYIASGEEFLEKYNYYRSSEVYCVPLNEQEYRVNNPTGANVRVEANAESSLIGKLSNNEIVIGHNAFVEQDSNGNYWVRIDYGDGFGWVAENNLIEVE